MKVFLILMLAMVVAIGGAVTPAMGADIVFNNEDLGDNYWHTDGNWVGGSAPTASDNAIIPSPLTCLIVEGGLDAVAESFEVRSGGTLIIDKYRKLTITAASTIEANGLLDLLGTLTTAADVTVEGSNDDEIPGGTIRLQKENWNYRWFGLIDTSGLPLPELTVEAGSGGNPGLVYGAGEIEVVIHNEGKVQGGCPECQGGWPLQNSLDMLEAVAGSGEWWSAYSVGIHFWGGVSGSGDWFTSLCQTAGASSFNGFHVKANSCITGNIEVSLGVLMLSETFCTTGTLNIGNNDHGICLPKIGVAPGKTARFNVTTCPVWCP